jgi:hypothetical protein
MSGALFSRIKNWVTGDTILASDVNAEFDNILAYFMPQYMDDYSATVGQMQTVTDPGESGTESLATSLSGELERLRFTIAEIKGTTYWYQTASSSISQLTSVFGPQLLANRISSGRMSANSSQPLFLIPDGTANTVKLAGAVTNFVYSIASTQYTISSNVTVTSLTLAPSSTNTCLVDDAALSGQAYSKNVGENGTSITVDTMGGSISALVGTYAAFKTSTEYFIARIASTTSLDKCQRGMFFNSADTRLARVALSNNDTITLMKLTWVYANTSGALTVSYTNPRYGGTAPTSPSTGDYWYDLTNNVWKTYNSTTWVAANATLVGVCIQDTTGTKAARSFDFFKNFADTNTVECIRDSINPTTQVSSRYMGSQLNVYGTLLKFEHDYLRWNVATDFDSGESLATNTLYYFYVKESGNVAISSVAPLDMREDRMGFYHPGEAYRCIGYGRTDASGSGTWQEVESFFVTDKSTNVTTLTAAVSNLLPQPYAPQIKERTFLCNVSGVAAFTQVLPPAAQYLGETLTYVKTDASIVSNVSSNAATIQTYVSTETVTSGTGAVTSLALATQGECVSLKAAAGNVWVITSRYIPSVWLTYTPTVTGFGAATSIAFFWRRVGDSMEVSGTFTAGTVTATLASVSLPGTYALDTTRLSITNNTTANPGTLVGWWRAAGTPNLGTGAVVAPGTSTTVVYSAISNAGLTPAATSSAFSSSLVTALVFTVPISGWSS